MKNSKWQRGNTTLSDVLTSESVKQIHAKFEEGMEFLQDLAAENDVTYFGVTKDTMEEAGAPILLFVYHALRNTAEYRPKESPFPGYPYKATGTIHDALSLNKRYMKETAALREQRGSSSTQLTNSVIRGLAGNDLARKKGRDVYLWLAPEYDGRRLNFVSSRGNVHDWQTEKAIEREEKVERPITASKNLRIIALPKSDDPEAYKKWIRVFVPAALAVQDDYDSLRQQVATLEQRIQELESKEQGKEWEEVGSELESLFQGGGDSGGSEGSS